MKIFREARDEFFLVRAHELLSLGGRERFLLQFREGHLEFFDGVDRHPRFAEGEDEIFRSLEIVGDRSRLYATQAG
jgi:hypothetical protein